MSDGTSAGSDRAAPRGPLLAWSAAVVGLVWLKAAPLSFVDPDVWHQMSLGRELVARGRMPLRDVFAYTPTIEPLVHHEWGAGLVWLGVASTAGAAGFLALKVALVAAVLGLAALAAHRRGADPVTLLAGALPAVLLAHYGFTTIRPQLWTLAFLAGLLALLPLDEPPRWRRLLPWLVVQAVWINVHAGAVVGLGFLWLAALERLARREPARPLLVTAALASALLLATPWGLDYPGYLLRALTMERPRITEWAPLWVDPARRWLDQVLWLAMVASSLYALWRRGWRACRGLSMVGAAAGFALLHQRHVTLLAVTWFALALPWLAPTPLAARLRGLVARRETVVTLVGGLAAALWIAGGALLGPWTLRVPADPESRALGQPTYPVGAVRYLERVGFEGDLMTPFVEGAYVMWRLHPRGVRISFDGRYEAAYPAEVARAHRTLYDGAEGWPAVLDAYPPDAILVPRHAPVIAALPHHPGFEVVYGDDLYVVLARPELALPFEDHRGRALAGRFP